MILESIVFPPLLRLRDVVMCVIPVYSCLLTNASDSAVGRAWFRKVLTCRDNVLPSFAMNSYHAFLLVFRAIPISG